MRRSDGFTLIEVIMIIVIVAVALPVLLTMMGTQARLGVNSELQVTSTNLGQMFMEELRRKCWDETAVSGLQCLTGVAVTPSAVLGPDAEATVAAYDDMDDYHGYSVTNSIGGVDYQIGISVCYVNTPALDTCLGTTTLLKKADVSVTHSQGVQTLTTLITRH